MKPDSKLRHKPEKTINSMLKIFKEKSNFYILLCIIGFKFARTTNLRIVWIQIKILICVSISILSSNEHKRVTNILVRPNIVIEHCALECLAFCL